MRKKYRKPAAKTREKIIRSLNRSSKHTCRPNEIPEKLLFEQNYFLNRLRNSKAPWHGSTE
jgi:hypothetical protein